MAVAKLPESLDLRDLRAGGSRVTAPRRAVLATVREGGHLAVEEIALLARRRLGAVSTQAVYDILRALAGTGLVRRIEPTGSTVRFEPWVGDNADHLICRACDTVVDVDCAVGQAPCLAPSFRPWRRNRRGGNIYWGVCPAARAIGYGFERQSHQRGKREGSHD